VHLHPLPVRLSKVTLRKMIFFANRCIGSTPEHKSQNIT
jgi:hypothetical protein